MPSARPRRSSTHALEPALAAAGLPGRLGRPRPLAGACGRLGAVRRSPPRPGRRPGFGPGRRPARRRRPPGRHAGQPPRHRRRVAGRRAGRRLRSLPRRRAPLPRPQGLQHAQRVLHPGGRRDLVEVFLGASTRPPASRTTGHVDVEAGLARPRRDRAPCQRAPRTGCVGDRREERLATEWEWEHSPEVSLVVDRRRRPRRSSCATATARASSPRWSATTRPSSDRFYDAVDAPFVGDGFTRWVDGQYALDTPELGLSNWQGGRLLGRGGVLSGASVHTVRYRARVADPGLHR